MARVEALSFYVLSVGFAVGNRKEPCVLVNRHINILDEMKEDTTMTQITK
jgi:hypothetical protein